MQKLSPKPGYSSLGEPMPLVPLESAIEAQYVNCAWTKPGKASLARRFLTWRVASRKIDSILGSIVCAMRLMSVLSCRDSIGGRPRGFLAEGEVKEAAMLVKTEVTSSVALLYSCTCIKLNHQQMSP